MRGRRSTAIVLFLAVAAGIAAGAGALYLFSGGFPWRPVLPWQAMEQLLETQVLAATAVDVSVLPGEGRLEGNAKITLKHPGGDGSEVALLLNPGLEISRITWEDRPVSWRRQEARLLVFLPAGAGAGSLRIDYAGVLQRANASPLLVAADELLVDRLQYWYPLDLKNFCTVDITLHVPEGLEVAWSGAVSEDGVQTGIRTVRWAEKRPVLAAGLAVGRYQRTSRVQGAVRCNIYARAADAAAVDAWLAAMGEAHNYFSSLYGSDQFEQLNLVVSDGITGACHLGGATIAAHPEALSDPETLFAALARLVARNWWGETVSGRWFSSRPEAGEWLVSGLSEYSAWQALRNIKGRRVYLRYMEQLHCPPESSAPMKTMNLGDALQGGAPIDDRIPAVRCAYAAAALAQYVGPDAFQRACRNFMAVHRYNTVSYAALLHEMTLASEKPLDELVRVWFDRPGTFDYAIASVTTDGGRVHVTIENRGDIPAFASMDIGLLTPDGYEVQSVLPGVHGNAFSFSFQGPLERVVLDPEFALGDMRRANNAWPPTQWPRSLDVSPNGRIALLSQSEWGRGSPGYLYIFSLVDKSAAYGIQTDLATLQGFQWNQDGQQLALQGAPAGVWNRREWRASGDGAVFLGWREGDPVFWRDGAAHSLAVPIASPPVPMPPPLPGLAAIHPRTGDIAYVSDAGVLVLWNGAASRLSPLREHVDAVGNLRWRAESRNLIYFQRDGSLLSIDAESGAETDLLQRNYRIAQARISDRGNQVAWVDPAGLLRAFSPGAGEPVYISLPGEVVDFAWEGEDALIAIVATVPRRLPMRFNANYTLWRIPSSTWSGVQLPYDPVQFAAASGSIELLRP